VLPDITPNIGADHDGRSPLPRYLESLARVERLRPEPVRVYPGHGAPFTGLADRARAIREHHRGREEALLALLRADGPRTVYELALALFGPLRDYHVALGAAEVHAHLDKLAAEGRAVVRDGHYRAG
jgi:hydroxyacylglutathione hydrolase